MGSPATLRARVLQGARVAGDVLLGGLTFVFLLIGLFPLAGLHPGRLGLWGDLLLLAIAIAILYATAHRWGRWVGVVLGARILFASLAILAVDGGLTVTRRPLPAMEAVAVPACCTLLIWLTWPLIASRYPFQPLDRLGLVAALVAVALSLLLYRRPWTWVWIALSLACFAVTGFRHRKPRRRSRQHTTIAP